MDYFNSWLICLEQTLLELLNSEDIYQSCYKLLNTLNYPCIYDNKHVPVGIQKLIYRMSDTDENYDSEENGFLNRVISADIVLKLTPLDFKNSFEIPHDNHLKINEVTIFCIDLNCHKNERDVIACALTKLINKAFLTLNIIFFRCDKEFSFGVRRMDAVDNVRNIIISKWYNLESDIQEISEYALDNFWSGNIKEFYINFGHLILENSHLCPKEFLFCEREFRREIDYVTALIDISDIYGINTSMAIEEYSNSFEKEKSKYADGIYDQITYEIRHIGLATLSSDAMLKIAEAELEKAQNRESPHRVNSTHGGEVEKEDEIDKKIRQIDDEAFLDAEKLLKSL